MAVSKKRSAKKGTAYRVSVYDPLTQKTKWVGTYYDKLEAEQAELSARKSVQAGLSPVGDRNPKIADLIEKWLLFARRESTREDYTRSSKFFIEYVGERRVRTLQPEDFHRFVAFMQGKKKSNGEPYSARFVRKVVTQFYQLVNFAVELGCLERSPAPKMKRLALSDAPSVRKVRLTSEQVRALLDAAPSEWRDLFIVALATGARRGELFSLTYGAIQREKLTIEVRDASVDGGSGGAKTAAAIRSIPVHPAVIQALADRKVKTRSEDDDLIFPNKDGNRMSYPNFYQRIWKPTVEKAGLEDLRLHDLRKAYATHLAATGRTPSYLEEVMGHRSYSTTMKYYTKTPDEEADRARHDLEGWIGREDSDDDKVRAA